MNLHTTVIRCILCFSTYNVILGHSEESVHLDTTGGYESLDPDSTEEIDADSLTEEEELTSSERTEQLIQQMLETWDDTKDEPEWTHMLNEDSIDKIDLDKLNELEQQFVFEFKKLIDRTKRAKEETEQLQKETEQLEKKTQEIQAELEETKIYLKPWRTVEKVKLSMNGFETELIEDYLKQEKIFSYISRQCRRFFKYCKKTNMVKRGIALFNLFSRPVKQFFSRLSNLYVHLSNTILKFF